MTYKATNVFTTKFIELSLSADQTVTTSSTLVNFDTITPSGSGVSLVSGGSGRIRFTGGKSYFLHGCVAIDRTSTSAVYTAKWYNTSGVEQVEASGACNSETADALTTESRVCQLLINPSSDVDYDLKVEGAAGDIKADGTNLIIMEFS